MTNDEYNVKREPNRQTPLRANDNKLPENLFTSEQNIIDWLSDLNTHYVAQEGTIGFGCLRTAEHLQRILYFATGRRFEVRQVIPPPTHPRPPHANRQIR